VRNRRTGTGLFLTELLAAVLIFSLAAGVSMRIFAFARARADDSRDLSGAVLAAESAAEEWKAGGGTLPTVYYDKSWQPCAAEKASFTLTMTEGDDHTARFEIAGGGRTVYALTARRTGGGS